MNGLWGAPNSTVLASRAVHPWALFRAKIDINKEIVHLVYMCGVNLSVMHCGPFFTRHLFSNKKFFMHHKYSAVKIQHRLREKKIVRAGVNPNVEL